MRAAAQVGHAVQAVTEYMVHNRLGEWRQYGMNPKIVLKATEEEMEDLAQRYKRRNARVWCVPVYDAGRTQIPANSYSIRSIER